jgi:hypothetical protein
MVPLTDTLPDAEQVVREAYRKMPFAQKWRQMGAVYHTARVLHAAGFRARHPGATDEQVQEDWWRAALGSDALPNPRRSTVSGNDDNVRVVQEVAAALSRLDIPYALGGSWASSLLGKFRFTHDADLTVEPFPGKEAALCQCFGEDYYVSLPAAQQAVRQRSSFNIVHTPTAFKVDLFVRKERPFERSVMARRRAYPLPGLLGQSISCVTAEDVILLKLEWYRLGGGASEQQLKDVIGVLQIQAGKLDQAYLDRWAADLGVADLLARVRQESGV